MREEYIYSAVVKKIKNGKWAETSDHKDIFVMEDMIGKTLLFRDSAEGKNWYIGEDGYSYHSSWIKNLRKINLSPTSKV